LQFVQYNKTCSSYKNIGLPQDFFPGHGNKPMAILYKEVLFEIRLELALPGREDVKIQTTCLL
jgi:hypothetical protein